MGHLWDIYGTSMRHLWDIYGTSMGHLLDIYGTSMRHICDIYGTFVGHLWDIYGTSMGRLWEINDYGALLVPILPVLFIILMGVLGSMHFLVSLLNLGRCWPKLRINPILLDDHVRLHDITAERRCMVVAHEVATVRENMLHIRRGTQVATYVPSETKCVDWQSSGVLAPKSEHAEATVLVEILRVLHTMHPVRTFAPRKHNTL